MRDQDIYASFFIRLWRSGKGSCTNHDEKMKFEIEHIQSGKVQLLNTQEEFLEFITSITNLPKAHD